MAHPKASRRVGRDKRHIELIAADDPSWEDWLGDVPRDVFHTAAYHEYAHHSGEGEPYLLVVGDRAQGMAWPYLLRPTPDREASPDPSSTDVTSVYGYPGPIAWGCLPGSGFLVSAWAEVIGVWRQQRAVSAFTRFHPLLDNALLVDGLAWPADGEPGGGGVIEAGPTVSVDLAGGYNGAQAGYGRDLRREIAAARREGLTTSEDEGWRDLAEFARLYRETMARNRAADYYYWEEGDFRRLSDSLGQGLHLLVTRMDEVVAAAGLFTLFDGIVECLLLASGSAFRSLSPTKVLIDDAVQWSVDRGASVLHLGGGRGGREDSLLWFKGRFSPRRHRFATGRWVLDAARYGDLVDRRRGGASEAIVGGDFFPAYRAPRQSRPR